MPHVPCWLSAVFSSFPLNRAFQDEIRQPFFRNHANGYGADIRNFANGYRGEALLEEEENEEFEEYEGKHHRRRSARGLVAVVIFAALAYFVLRRMGLW